ncbi:MAG TPA: alanine racemase [Candidatus Binatia bacterium]|nr:alanine racemase [Candidatus Binatia bacterium]
MPVAPQVTRPSSAVFGATPEIAELERLARYTGTPAYVLFEQSLRDNYAALHGALTPAQPVRLYYSVKSNFETGVLATLCDMGSGAEISGGVERLAVERAGFEWSRVVFDGPIKDEAELSYAIARGVHLVNVESDEEIETLRRLARRAGRRVRIGVRLNPEVPPPAYDRVFRTFRHKFGFLMRDIDRLATRLKAIEELEWVALMAHVGSQVMRADRYLATLDQFFAAAARLRAAGITIGEINLGGGLPADSMLNVRVPRRFVLARWCERLGWLQAPAEFAATMAARIAEHATALRRTHRLPLTIALEPGRALVANAGVMLARVHVVKPPWVFVDVSLNDLPEKLSLCEWRLACPTRVDEPVTQRWHIAGPTLATQDVLFYDHPVPRLQRGDIIAVLDTGAYSIARANQFTRPRSAVFFVDVNGELQLIRRGEVAADVLHTQLPANPAATGS